MTDERTQINAGVDSGEQAEEMRRRRRGTAAAAATGCGVRMIHLHGSTAVDTIMEMHMLTADPSILTYGYGPTVYVLVFLFKR
jgi:hypothetical protein